MKKIKTILSLMLVSAMLLTCLPTSFAADSVAGNLVVSVQAKNVLPLIDMSAWKNEVDAGASTSVIQGNDSDKIANLLKFNDSNLNGATMSLMNDDGNYYLEMKNEVYDEETGESVLSGGPEFIMTGLALDSGVVRYSYRAKTSDDKAYFSIVATATNTTHAQGRKWQSVDVRLVNSNNVWNDVAVEFDFVNYKLRSFVTYGGITETSEVDLYIRDLTKVNYKVIPSNVFGSTAAVDDICVEQILPVSDAVTSYFGDTQFVVLSGNAVKVTAYANDVLLGESNATNGLHTFNIDSDDVGFGSKDIKVTAYYRDGSVKFKTIRINLIKVEEFAIAGATAERQSFDNMAALDNALLDRGQLSSFKSTGWDVASRNAVSTMFITRGNGRYYNADTNPNDYAFYCKLPATNTANDANAYSVNLVESVSSTDVMATSGRFVMDFDIKVNSNDGLEFLAFPLWGDAKMDGHKLLENGVVRDTTKTITPGTWYHFNMVYDIDGNKWYVTVDDELIINGNTPHTESYVKNNEVKFRQGWNATAAANGAGFALDNIKVNLEKVSPYVTSINYGNTPTVNTIPSDVSGIDLVLNQNVTCSTGDVELYIDGEKQDNPVVACNNNMISVTLPELNVNQNIKVVLKNTIPELIADMSALLYVTDNDGKYLKVGDGAFSDTHFTALVDCVAADKLPIQVFAAAYVDNELVSVIPLAGTVVHGNAALKVDLDGLRTDEDVVVKVMVWDSVSTLIPLIEATPFTNAVTQ